VHALTLFYDFNPRFPASNNQEKLVTTSIDKAIALLLPKEIDQISA
jgi:hypothetical protein